jgi:translocation and assembly module TamA
VFGSSATVRGGPRRAALALLAGLAAAAGTAAAQPALRFRTEIEAPTALAAALRENLDLIRWQDYDALTPEVLDRLVGEARAQAAEILATRGYFSPRVEARREPGDPVEVVRLTVEPGEPTRVRGVRIELTGPAVDDPASAARLDEIRRQWSLPEGQTFSQSEWNVAKAEAVAAFARERYGAASIESSRATIDPAARAADLELVIASGPPFTFGEVEIVGLSRHSEQSVRNLSPVVAGEPFSRETLERYQRRLIATNYFASVQVTVAPDPERPDRLPVRVSVIEAPTKRADIGIGYSTDTLWRLQLDYRDVDVLGTGFRLNSTLRLESKIQGLAGALEAPAAQSGWLDAYSAGVEFKQVEGLDTEAFRLGWTRRLVEERDQPAYGVSYIYEEQEPAGLPRDATYALMANFWYTWRRTDNLVDPRKGWNATLHLAAAPPGVSSREFGRAVGKLSWFGGFGRNLDVVLRAESGIVIASSSNGIPQAVLFRTGGDNTVRGYDFESLGVRSGNAVVGGRYYALATAESIYWVGEGWGLAAFVDAGNAFDDFDTARLALGYGIGARVRTPAGPLRLDVAYGRDVDEFRIHFSFGLTF